MPFSSLVQEVTTNLNRSQSEEKAAEGLKNLGNNVDKLKSWGEGMASEARSALRTSTQACPSEGGWDGQKTIEFLVKGWKYGIFAPSK